MHYRDGIVYVLCQHGLLSWHWPTRWNRVRGAWQSSQRVNLLNLSEKLSSFPGVLAPLCKSHFVFNPQKDVHWVSWDVYLDMHFKSIEKCTSGNGIKRKTSMFVTDKYLIQMMQIDNEWVWIALVWIGDSSEDEWLYPRQWADISPSDLWPKKTVTLLSPLLTLQREKVRQWRIWSCMVVFHSRGTF